MNITIRTDLEQLLAQYEQSIKSLTRDQWTDDAMNNQKFKGVEETYTTIIQDLKKILNNSKVS